MSTEYFNRLNYTLANEDTSLELEVLPANVGHLFSVAGSGGRVLPLFAKQPRLVTCVDLAQEQLSLTELRLESARVLDHSEFIDFWGYPRAGEPLISAESRRKLFQKIELQQPTRLFFETLFSQINWESLLYLGRWERTFAKLSRGVRKITGPSATQLFQCKTLAEQQKYLEHDFPHIRWGLTLLLLGNASVFNALLYKGSFPEKNIPESMVGFYRGAFDRLFHRGLARKNFFLQLAFFGKIIYPEGCPIECDPTVYAAAQAGLRNAQIRYVRGDLVEQIKKSPDPIDFLSFSDVPSYFKGSLEIRFLQEIRSHLQPAAKVVIRNYLRIPEGLDSSGFSRVESKFQSAIDCEKVQMYRVEIFELERKGTS